MLWQAPLDKSGTFVEVQLKALGFQLEVQSENTAKLMFVRDDGKLLWEAFNQAVEQKHNLSVNGPPGTGKSTEAWAWALWHAKTQGMDGVGEWAPGRHSCHPVAHTTPLPQARR